MTDISFHDLAALAWFVLWWGGYTYYADTTRRAARSLPAVMRRHREAWMLRLLRREARIVDTTIISAIMRSVSLFASTTIFILAGLLAILGAMDKARALVQDIPFVAEASTGQWELKILLLLVLFIYAFFKFAWSLRQFNYAVVLIGAAPPPDEADTPFARDFARGAADVISGAVLNFNRGMRTYYFGLAALSWFLHPVLFALVTVWVAGVVYRREFRSHTLTLLEGIPAPSDGENP
ncbi:MAG: DUF599 family protein [Alphaproteobacteria bacterium]|nr:DUF599 family protein [Alphaproteobacteria bacterium]